VSSILQKRRAGILLHITSLPGNDLVGDLGQEAYHFINFLKDAGISVWQTLPIGTTHADRSPYQSLSAHAGNPDLISIDWFFKKDWLRFSDLSDQADNPYQSQKNVVFDKAYEGFTVRANEADKTDFTRFCQEKAFWLDDFALFMVLRAEFKEQSWNQWPEKFKNRDTRALQHARRRFQLNIEAIKFQQYVFNRQWLELKAYANQNGVLLFGDIPIFVSYDSVDVWTNRDVFKLAENGEMLVVAGVPPDYFSATGQRWGNPHYDWNYLKKTGFHWWLERLETQLELFDILRIDHFRGLEAAWEIPAHEDTAINGEWVQAPGHALLTVINNTLGDVPLVAEDLGIITPEVEALRDDFNLPGMKILQFAFGGGADNPYLPSNYSPNCVAYTGTHDNDTTLGWLEKLNHDERQKIHDYLGHPQMPLHYALIHAALGSVAHLAVIPMQDILELGTEHRMNTPGTTQGNWAWRFNWDQVTSERVEQLKHLVYLFNRQFT
jgi:4-alpha-glucanotransferase